MIPLPSIAKLETAPIDPPRGSPAPPEVARWLTRGRQRILARWCQSQFDPERIARYSIAGVEGRAELHLRNGYVKPLLDLLIAYAKTGKPEYRSVYLDERLRFSPHRSDPAVRRTFFAELLEAHQAAIFEEVPAEPRLLNAIRSFWVDLHAPLLTDHHGQTTRVLAVGDCLMTELRVFLQGRCRDAGIHADVRNLYFSALEKQEISPGAILEFLAEFPADLIAMSFLSYEGLPPYAALMAESRRLSATDIDRHVVSITALVRKFLNALRERTDAPFLLHNVSGLPLTRFRKRIPGLRPLSRGRRRVIEALNAAIRELVEHTPNTLLIDEKQIVEREGYHRSSREVVPRSVSRGAFFHTARLGDFLATSYVDVVRSFDALRKAKVLVVDFDNTLWNGVMAEGPVVHEHERQELLRRLREAGILLVVASKNDAANIRWAEMRLAMSDFVLQKINWNPKVESIRQAVAQLNLGLDSVVFVDDSPVEREFVRSHLPSVAVLDANDPFTWRSLERLLRFPNTRETTEAKDRTEMYRKQAERREVLVGSLDYPAMMASLRLVARFGRASRRDLGRVEELVQRTNQFNTTTIRYSRSQLEEYLNGQSHRIYVVDVSDKFCSLGLVGVAIVQRSADQAVFESFVMSCRAMGFQLERLMLRKVIENESDAGAYVGRFVQTDRNSPAASLFRDAGFVSAGETEWILDVNRLLPELPAWFEVLNRS